MKVLMVCLGNICRSPLAEGILRHKIETQNLDWQVDSCGTSGWHNGERPQAGSLNIAKQHGVDMTGIRSRKFQNSDFDNFDLIIVMDEQNQIDVLNLARSEEDENKIKLLLSYDKNSDTNDVPDPYYVGGFDIVYDMLDLAIDEMIESIEN